MPKRSREDEDSDDYIHRKMRKIEKKLRKCKRRFRRVSSSSSDSRVEGVAPELSLLEDNPASLILDSVDEEVADLNVTPNACVEDNIEPTPGPSTAAQVDNEYCRLSEEILKLIGDSPLDAKKCGQNIHKDIALRWQHIATTGLPKEEKKTLLEKHLVPENGPKLAAPSLNLEIKAAISDILIGKDKASCAKQNQIASIIACVGDALSNILKSEVKDTTIIKSLLDSGQLLCDLQFTESMKRRSLICASIKKEIKCQLYETKIDTHLFGENLADTLKAAKVINKSGSEIKATKPRLAARTQSRALNTKSQLVNSRQPARGRQEPASYIRGPATPPAHAQAWRRQYSVPPPLPSTALPPPPPPLPLQQQQPKPRQYQRR